MITLSLQAIIDNCNTAGETPNAFQWLDNPKNCPFSLGNLNPHVICGSLDPAESASQAMSRSVQLFLQQTDRPTSNVPSWPSE